MLCKALCLKPKSDANRDVHVIMFFHLCHCDEIVYERVLRLFATEPDYIERNTQVRALLGIPSHLMVATEEIKSFADRTY